MKNTNQLLEETVSYVVENFSEQFDENQMTELVESIMEEIETDTEKTSIMEHIDNSFSLIRAIKEEKKENRKLEKLNELSPEVHKKYQDGAEKDAEKQFRKGDTTKFKKRASGLLASYLKVAPKPK